MNEASRVQNLSQVLSAPLVWTVDPDEIAWLRAEFEDDYLYLRMNSFPDNNPYSLWLGDGRYLELDDMPATWKRQGPLEWPPTARPARHLQDED